MIFDKSSISTKCVKIKVTFQHLHSTIFNHYHPLLRRGYILYIEKGWANSFRHLLKMHTPATFNHNSIVIVTGFMNNPSTTSFLNYQQYHVYKLILHPRKIISTIQGGLRSTTFSCND